MTRRVRGRRVLLLLASALPVLAKDDVPIIQHTLFGAEAIENGHIVDEDENDVAEQQATALRGAASTARQQQPPVSSSSSSLFRLDESDLNDLVTAGWASDSFDQYNTSVPLRPPYSAEFHRYQTQRAWENKRRRVLGDQDIATEIVVMNETHALIERSIMSGTSKVVEEEENVTAPELESAANATAIEETNTTVANKAFTTEDDAMAEDAKDRMVVDYASKSAGALILESSANFKGTSNLLNGDKDRYAIVPCEQEPKFVVVGLSEDILVKQVVLANYERYSSHIKEFVILGSQTVGHWVDLGTYQADSTAGRQVFDLKKPSWARYLKFRFLNHFGDEHYCTVSQISVHGSTMVQGFHEQWEESEAEEDATEESINDILSEDSMNAALDDMDGVDADQQPSISDDSLNERVVIAEELSSPRIQCIAKLNDMCPNELAFEQSMFLFGSADFAEFEMLDGALSSASICLGSSGSSKSNLSGSLQQLERGAITTVPPKSGDTQNIVTRASKTETQGALSDSPMINRIQNLMKTTAGVDMNLDPVGINTMAKELSKESVTVTEALIGKFSTNVEAPVSKAIQGERKAQEVKPLHSLTPPVLTAIQTPELESPPAEKKVTEVKLLPSSTSTVVKDAASAIVAEVAEKRVGPAEKVEEDSHDSLQETGSALGKMLGRLPNADCLSELDFAKFKAKILSVRAGNTKTGGPAGAGGIVEPIFKKLADEIRTLQTSVSVHDQFAKASIACYQRVMLDLVVELEALRLEQDARISMIEQELRRGPQWRATLRNSLSFVTTGFTSTLGRVVNYSLFNEGSLLVDCLRFTGFLLLLSLLPCAMLVAVATRKRSHTRKVGSRTNYCSSSTTFSSKKDRTALSPVTKGEGDAIPRDSCSTPPAAAEYTSRPDKSTSKDDQDTSIKEPPSRLNVSQDAHYARKTVRVAS